MESYIFYEIKRFDIKGKEYLRTLGKYYIVDIGLRNYLLGFRDVDTGHCIENIVYFELLRRGYDVAIGKIDEKEVDFIAVNAKEKRYFQVTESMNNPSTRERELAPLRKIRDNSHQIEWLTAMHYFDDIIPASSKIFDGCAGTGNDAFKLSEQGHRVAASDIVPHNIDIIIKR